MLLKHVKIYCAFLLLSSPRHLPIALPAPHSALTVDYVRVVSASIVLF